MRAFSVDFQQAADSIEESGEGVPVDIGVATLHRLSNGDTLMMTVEGNAFRLEL